MGEKGRVPEREQTAEQKKQHKKRVRIGIASACIAGAAFIGVGIGMAFTPCYTVEYQGSPIAYMDNKDAMEAAVLRAETLVSDLLETDYTFGQEIQVKAAIVPRKSVSPLPEATDSLMEKVPELRRLYTLTVDGVYIGAAERAETVTQALEQVKDLYRTDATISLAIKSDLDLSYQFLPSDTETMDANQLVRAMLRQVTHSFSYTTQDGDTLESIARQFGMSRGRLEELNSNQDLEIEATDADIASLDEILGDTKLSAQEAVQEEPAEDEEVQVQEGQEATDDILPEDLDEVDQEALAAEAVREAYAAVDAASAVTVNEEELVLTDAPLSSGQTLNVELVCALLLVDTVEEQVTDREVAPEKFTLLDSTIPVGTQEVLVEGSPGSETVMSRITKRCGVPVAASDLSSISREQAEPLLVAVGYGSHPELYDFFGVDSLLFQWPVQGRISSDYGYRQIFGGLNFHRGVDIPAPMGTAVHAAADGTVIFAGVKGSYGNLVIIDHGNGFETLYGHNSGFLVKAGDVVKRGQTIAAVGSTGRSTGPHCHFEVHLNGELVDPLMYLPDENNAPIRMQVPLSELNQQMEEVDPNETAQKPAETAPAAKPAETQPAPDSPADEPSGQISFDGARTPAESEVGALLAEPEEAPPEETAEAPAAESPPAPVQEAAAEPPAASVPAVPPEE